VKQRLICFVQFKLTQYEDQNKEFNLIFDVKFNYPQQFCSRFYSSVFDESVRRWLFGFQSFQKLFQKKVIVKV